MDVRLIEAYKNGGLKQVIHNLSNKEVYSVLTENAMMPSEVAIKSIVLADTLRDTKDFASIFINNGQHKNNTLIVLRLLVSARKEDASPLSIALIHVINTLSDSLPITFEAILSTSNIPWFERNAIGRNVRANRALY